MNAMSREARRNQIIAEEQRYRKIKKLKLTMAEVLLKRIQEEQAENPAVEQFDAPVRRPLTPVEHHLLSRDPDVIASQLKIGRKVTMSLDESVEPPVLHVELGEPIEE